MDKSIITKYRVKKILKISSIVLLVLFLLLLVFGFVRTIPKDIEVTNVSSSSFTVSWSTRFPTKGAITVIDTKNSLPVAIFPFDQLYNDTRDERNAELSSRDKTGKNADQRDSFGVKITDFVVERVIKDRGSYYTHHVEVVGLEESTSYRVMIGDGFFFYNMGIFSDDFNINTEVLPSSIQTPHPVYGLVKDSEGKDLPVDSLKPLTDGIIYFTLVDENTNERSNTFSSSLSGTGSWYLDISSATDSNGEKFLDRLNSEITNILGEIIVNAGPHGSWKKTVSINEISPAETIVLNARDIVQDASNPDGLIRIDTMNILPEGTIKSVNAGSCLWIGYCSCGYYAENKWNDCECDPQSTYEARGCDKQENASAAEAAQEVGCTSNCGCAGGGSKGDRVFFSGQCKECGVSKEGYWGNINNSLCESNQNGSIFTPNDREPCQWNTATYADDPLCVDPTDDRDRTLPCEQQGDETATVYDMSSLTLARLCWDPDGCDCEYRDTSRNSSVSCNESCPAETQGTGSGEDIDICEIEDNGYASAHNMAGTTSPRECEDPDGCSCTYNNEALDRSVRCGSPCPSASSLGDSSDNEPDGPVSCSTSSADDGYHCTISFDTDAPRMVSCQDPDGCQCVYSYIPRTDNVSQSENCSTYEGGDGYVGAHPVLEITAPETCDIAKTIYVSCLCHKKNSNGESVTTTIADEASCADDPVIQPVETPVITPTVTPTAPGSFLIEKILGKKVFAQEEEPSYTEYVIDQTSSSINILNAGRYIFELEGVTYLLDIDSADLQNGTVRVYIDTNSNNKYDEGIDNKISDLASIIKVSQVHQNFSYNFTAGYNFISVPFLLSDYNQRTAYGLLSYLNESLDNMFFSLAKYDGTWDIVGTNGGEFEGEDFQLVPGVGYILKSKGSGSISLSGYPVLFDTSADSAPITLYPGWNLIGTYGTNVKQYTAKSLIQSINSYEPVDFTADNVSRWESDVQRYDGLQITNENGIDIEYGFDFPINTLQSYFVRILNGRGNWQQDIRE